MPMPMLSRAPFRRFRECGRVCFARRAVVGCRAFGWAVVGAAVMMLGTIPVPAAGLGFMAGTDGGFRFDTGVLRGKLRVGGKSMGLQEVTHLATRQRLDRSNGLLSHYRVFTAGQRYGGGAWDWPSTARLRDDGAVEVSWPEVEGRPIEMRAVYRWRDAATVDLETTVKGSADLRGLEVFVASYFHERFTNAMVAVATAGAGGSLPVPTLVRATREEGEWQMFPRDDGAVALIRDGRWKLEPNPVDWMIRSPFARPLFRRRALSSGLNGVLMAPAEECFAVATPFESEGHYSGYFSLFGRDLRAGETHRARVRLTIAVAKSDAAVLAMYDEARKEWDAAGPGR
jgi:hypothetical protein